MAVFLTTLEASSPQMLVFETTLEASSPQMLVLKRRWKRRPRSVIPVKALFL